MRIYLIYGAISGFRVLPLRARPVAGDADRGALPPGRGRRAQLGGRARDDRDDVPGAARAGEGNNIRFYLI